MGRALPDLTRLAVRPVTTLPRLADGRIDLDRAASLLQPADLLESASAPTPVGAGWSYVVPHGGPRLVDDGHTTVLLSPGAESVTFGTDPFRAIDELGGALGVGPGAPRDAALPPFTGGLVGALAYDLARRVETLRDGPPRDRRSPDLSLRVAGLVLAVAPDRSEALLLSHGARRRTVDEVVRRLASAEPADPGAGPQRRQPVTSSLPRERHLDAVREILRAIGRGDVFQVNLTQRLTARWSADVWALYRAMRGHSAAAYGAVLPELGVASVSPETFLDVDGALVRTRPVKGTRPRASDAGLDAALADDLVTSAKDRAENVMVVDLERNDLGRVCVPGSIRVPELVRLEAHPTVWHLVSTVQGRLRPGTGYGELLRAVFPCGSITGAPKVAAMRLIDRLEPVRRGWYCGAIGFLAPGAATLSVAIRTATLDDGHADYGAGGGIVADSDPGDEHAESLDKAAAFLRAVGASPSGIGEPHPEPLAAGGGAA